MELLHRRCCGLDVHKETVVACLCLMSDGKVTTEVRTLHRPASRRCGCWPTSTVLFRGIVVGSFGAGRWRSGDRRRC